MFNINALLRCSNVMVLKSHRFLCFTVDVDTAVRLRQNFACMLRKHNMDATSKSEHFAHFCSSRNVLKKECLKEIKVCSRKYGTVTMETEDLVAEYNDKMTSPCFKVKMRELLTKQKKKKTFERIPV